jgi:hypothetical protein
LPDSCLTRKRRGNKGELFGGVRGVKGVKGVKTNAFVDMKLNSTPYHTGQKKSSTFPKNLQHSQKLSNFPKM